MLGGLCKERAGGAAPAGAREGVVFSVAASTLLTQQGRRHPPNLEKEERWVKPKPESHNGCAAETSRVYTEAHIHSHTRCRPK